MDLNFRTLRADEIEIRVGTVSAKGASLLLYKDARVDMTLLDEVVGPLNWKREHSRENANCIVSVWDDDKAAWVSKEDVGTQSNTEAEKGLASDSFKRACVNWGIGRELYSSPFIWVTCPTKPRDGGRGYELVNRSQFAGAYVKEIAYDENRNVKSLVVCDKNGHAIFSTTGEPVKLNNNDALREELLNEIKTLSQVKGISIEEICAKGRVDSLEDMETPRLENVIKWLAGE